MHILWKKKRRNCIIRSIPHADTHALCKIDMYVSHLSVMRAYSRSETRTDVECSSSLKHRWQSDCEPKAYSCGFGGKRALAWKGTKLPVNRRRIMSRRFLFPSVTAIVRYLLEKFNSPFAHKELDPESFYGPRSCHFFAQRTRYEYNNVMRLFKIRFQIIEPKQLL